MIRYRVINIAARIELTTLLEIHDHKGIVLKLIETTMNKL